MRTNSLRLPLLVAAAAALFGGAAPASAQVQGPCTASFNGVEAERIDSLSSPLLLGDDEALVFSGTDAMGTRSAAVEVLLGPATLGRGASTPGTATGEFLASVDLGDVAPYGVGLLRIRATTDNCDVAAWLRLGGRLPFTTLVGLTGAGLALAGLIGQISAIVARRRWSAPVAAGAGVATGAGGALIGQELGRLQLSYPSLAACIALAAALGLGVALLRRPRPEAAPSAPEKEAAAPGPPGPRQGATAPQSVPEPTPRAAAAPVPTPETPGGSRPTAPERPASPAAAPAAPRPVASGPFWSYVMGDVEVLDLDDYSRVVSVLRPGTWYLAKREVSGWAQVVAADGVEGWVPRQALHREG